MEKIRLKRMNHPDLAFRGKLMASADKEQTTGAAPMRLRLFLYETDVGRLILAVEVMSQPRFSDSKTFHGALAFDSLDTIRDFLDSEDGQGLSETAALLLNKTRRAPRTATKQTNRVTIQQSQKRSGLRNAPAFAGMTNVETTCSDSSFRRKPESSAGERSCTVCAE